jgi:hypothetical protein
MFTFCRYRTHAQYSPQKDKSTHTHTHAQNTAGSPSQPKQHTTHNTGSIKSPRRVQSPGRTPNRGAVTPRGTGAPPSPRFAQPPVIGDALKSPRLMQNNHVPSPSKGPTQIPGNLRLPSPRMAHEHAGNVNARPGMESPRAVPALNLSKAVTRPGTHAGVDANPLGVPSPRASDVFPSPKPQTYSLNSREIPARGQTDTGLTVLSPRTQTPNKNLPRVLTPRNIEKVSLPSSLSSSPPSSSSSSDASDSESETGEKPAKKLEKKRAEKNTGPDQQASQKEDGKSPRRVPKLLIPENNANDLRTPQKAPAAAAAEALLRKSAGKKGAGMDLIDLLAQVRTLLGCVYV